jgi:TolA-binding protein
MMDSTDMSTPVTRGELQDALLQVKQEHWRDLREVTAPLATKVELDIWGGALVARIQHGEQRLDNLERGQERLIGLVQQTQQQIQQSEQRLLAELARHTSAVYEGMRTQIKASTEPLDDLPGRVNRLETEVFGPAPGKRRTRRRSH